MFHFGEFKLTTVKILVFIFLYHLLKGIMRILKLFSAIQLLLVGIFVGMPMAKMANYKYRTFYDSGYSRCCCARPHYRPKDSRYLPEEAHFFKKEPRDFHGATISYESGPLQRYGPNRPPQIRSVNQDDYVAIEGSQNSTGEHPRNLYAKPYRHVYQVPDTIGVPVFTMTGYPDRIRALKSYK